MSPLKRVQLPEPAERRSAPLPTATDLCAKERTGQERRKAARSGKVVDGRAQEVAESELSDAGVARLQRDGVGPRFGTICDGIVVGKLGMSISSLMVGNTDGCVINLRFDGVIDALRTPCPPGGALPSRHPRCHVQTQNYGSQMKTGSAPPR